jgi:hypothetical protein
MKNFKMLLFASIFLFGGEMYVNAQEAPTGSARVFSKTLPAEDVVVGLRQIRSSSELSFSKSFDNESLETEKSFIINESAQKISLSLQGSAENGVIKLTLLKPDGKEYQVLEIDNASDLRWRQSFHFEEEDNNYRGKWKIKIDAKNASGRYMFRMVSQ